jgi:hypothetical protein
MKTILKHIFHIDFDDFDDDEGTHGTVAHEVFGHGPQTGQNTYGIEHTNSLSHLSDATITRHQAYTLQYHKKIKLAHPSTDLKEVSVAVGFVLHSAVFCLME